MTKFCSQKISLHYKMLRTETHEAEPESVEDNLITGLLYIFCEVVNNLFTNTKSSKQWPSSVLRRFLYTTKCSEQKPMKKTEVAWHKSEHNLMIRNEIHEKNRVFARHKNGHNFFINHFTYKRRWFSWSGDDREHNLHF